MDFKNWFLFCEDEADHVKFVPLGGVWSNGTEGYFGVSGDIIFCFNDGEIGKGEVIGDSCFGDRIGDLEWLGDIG